MSPHFPASLALKEILAWVLPALLLGLVAALAVLLRRSRRRSRFLFRFNILWDQKKRPFCPRCFSMLNDWQKHYSWKFESQGGRTVRNRVAYQAFKCEKCGKVLRLTDEDGFELTYDQAVLKVFSPEEGEKENP